MASRPPRTAKSDSTSKNPPTQAENPGEELEAGATIKDASLERREIPSYSDSREARIAERAYWRAERRGFTPGGEVGDWLEAEREIDQPSDDSAQTSSDEHTRTGRS